MGAPLYPCAAASSQILISESSEPWGTLFSADVAADGSFTVSEIVSDASRFGNGFRISTSCNATFTINEITIEPYPAASRTHANTRPPGIYGVSINGVEYVFDPPPQEIGGRTLMSVRMVAVAIGADVRWDRATLTAVITTR